MFEPRPLLVALMSVSIAAAASFACEATQANGAPEPNDAGTIPETRADTGLDAAPDARVVPVVCETPEELVALPVAGEAAPYRNLSPGRYQFGRCELVALLLDTAGDVADALPDAGPIGIADLSEQSGAIPGTDVDAPRHPVPSHTNGFSADITYFRANGRTLEDSPACPSKTREFCDGPHDLDVPANAKLFARLARSGRLAQIIVDPVMVSDIDAALAALAGVDGAAQARALLTSGIPFHADHFHVSVSRACYDGRDNDGDGLVDLDDPDCADAVDDDEGT